VGFPLESGGNADKNLIFSSSLFEMAKYLNKCQISFELFFIQRSNLSMLFLYYTCEKNQKKKKLK